MMAVDRAANAARVAELVRASGAQLGAVVDADGEQLTIVDDEGTVLTDDQALLVLLQPRRRDRARRRVSRCPVGASRAAEAICAEAGVRGHLHQAFVGPPDGGGGSGQGISFAASQNGRLHVAPIPARLRRRGDAWPSW